MTKWISAITFSAMLWASGFSVAWFVQNNRLLQEQRRLGEEILQLETQLRRIIEQQGCITTWDVDVCQSFQPNRCASTHDRQRAHDPVDCPAVLTTVFVHCQLHARLSFDVRAGDRAVIVGHDPAAGFDQRLACAQIDETRSTVMVSVD